MINNCRIAIAYETLVALQFNQSDVSFDFVGNTKSSNGTTCLFRCNCVDIITVNSL